MLIHPTVERLRALGLAAMADAFMELQNASDAGELSREDWLGLLVDREATSRENKRLARRLREARLRQSAVVEDVDFRPIAASTAPCSASSPPANGSASITTWS
jgi:IstB-like ATP binding protein